MLPEMLVANRPERVIQMPTRQAVWHDVPYSQPDAARQSRAAPGPRALERETSVDRITGFDNRDRDGASARVVSRHPAWPKDGRRVSI